MLLTRTYPASRYELVRPIARSDWTVRERLGSDAVRAFFNIVAHRKIRDGDARGLVGGMSNGVQYALKKGRGRELDERKLRRVSILAGIFEALTIFHGEKEPDRWASIPDKNRILGGTTPHEYLTPGVLPASATVRKSLDIRGGGQ